jgi:hypothetical protein
MGGAEALRSAGSALVFSPVLSDTAIISAIAPESRPNILVIIGEA